MPKVLPIFVKNILMARLLVLLLLSASFTLGDDRFINPPDISTQTGPPSSYPVFAVGDIMDVSWVSSDIVDLVINQFNSPETEIDRTPNSDALTTSEYSWKITTDGSDGGAKFDLTFSNMFNFLVFEVNSTTFIAQSAFFNISNSTIDQHGKRIIPLTTTTRLPISTSSSTSRTSSILSTSSASLSSSSTQSYTSSSFVTSASSLSASVTTKVIPPETSTDTTSSTKHEGLSMGASVGLGVGVGVAGLAAIAGVIALCLSLKRKRKSQQSPALLYYDLHSTAPSVTSFKRTDAHENWSPPSELSVLRATKMYPSGMPTSGSRRGTLNELPS